MNRVILLACLLSVAVHGADSIGYKAESQRRSEVFTSKVLKVYSAQEGECKYTAYVVAWRDQEVVVTEREFGTPKTYKVGDTVRCMMMSLIRPRKEGTSATMSFILMDERSDPVAMVVLNPTPGEEQARLEAVAAEIARRRTLRETGAEEVMGPPQKK